MQRAAWNVSQNSVTQHLIRNRQYPYIYTSIHPYIHTSKHPYIYTSVYLYIYVWMHGCMDVWMFGCMDTFIHPYIHTSIRPYIQISKTFFCEKRNRCRDCIKSTETRSIDNMNQNQTSLVNSSNSTFPTFYILGVGRIH